MERDIFKEKSLKKTKSRETILHLLHHAPQPMTAEEIYLASQETTPVTLSTAYRVLATLTEKDILLKTLNQNGKVYFQINNQQHKHVLKCLSCNEVALIEDCPLEVLEGELERKTGYRITGHNLEFSGLCPRCADRK